MYTLFLIQGTAKRKCLFYGYWKMVYLHSNFIDSFFWKEAKFSWFTDNVAYLPLDVFWN